MQIANSSVDSQPEQPSWLTWEQNGTRTPPKSKTGAVYDIIMTSPETAAPYITPMK